MPGKVDLIFSVRSMEYGNWKLANAVVLGVEISQVIIFGFQLAATLPRYLPTPPTYCMIPGAIVVSFPKMAKSHDDPRAALQNIDPPTIDWVLILTLRALVMPAPSCLAVR